jgi:hypothetical protein
LVPGIDLASVALEADYEKAITATEKPATIVVRKPSGQGFFRCHPIHHKNVRMLEVKNGPDRGYYLVAGAAKDFLLGNDNSPIRLFACRLTLCYSRDTGLFLWPLKLPEPGKGSRIDEWSQSALRIAKLAETQWVQLFTPPGANCYSYVPGDQIRTEPVWPDFGLDHAAALAFEGKYITDPEDPLIRRLLGKE